MLDKFVDFLTTNKEWLVVAVPIATFLLAFSGKIISIISVLFRFLFRRFFFDTEEQESYDFVNAKTKYVEIKIKKEPAFFGETNFLFHFFFKELKIRDINRYDKKIGIKKLIKKSYLMIGEAGCGKSSYIKYDFMKTRKKLLSRGKVCQVFLFSTDLIELLESDEKRNRLFQSVVKARYKKLYLYLDGIDEIGEDRINKYYDFIHYVSSELNLKKLLIKITSRPEFANKFINKPFKDADANNAICFHKCVEIEKWDNKKLLRYCRKLIRHLIRHKYESFNSKLELYKSLKNDEKWKRFISSPLLMKLYIYCRLQSSDSVDSFIDNTYKLYDSFVSTIIKVYRRRNNTPKKESIYNNAKQKFSSIVFNGYTDNSKKFAYTSECEFFSPIIKRIDDNCFTFVHETFYEYFVAKYYFNCMKKSHLSHNEVKVLCNNYSNDFADFITDSLNSEERNIRIDLARKFCKIYIISLDKYALQAYEKSNVFSETNKVNIGYVNLNRLSDREFFSLKYEIIFRLGRLNLDEQFIIDFLSFVYYNDTNVKQTDDKDYYIAVLHRYCAISSSFIGGEEIEIDYVNHMLPFKTQYKKSYDLANRTHTLLFYGDVLNGNIFDFRDEDPDVEFKRAFNKRLERLSTFLPDSVSDMNSDKKLRKKYYFRLFDLATIYTFIVDRKYQLNKTEREIIKNSRCQFTGASCERNALMSEIKDNIINFSNNF